MLFPFHLYLHSARRALYLCVSSFQLGASQRRRRPRTRCSVSGQRVFHTPSFKCHTTGLKGPAIIDSARKTDQQIVEGDVGRRRMVTSMAHNDDVVADSNGVISG